MLLATILLSISLSLDALGVAISYGIKKVRINLLPQVMLFISSITWSYIGLIIGNVFSKNLGEQKAEYIGIICMIIVGCWIMSKSTAGTQKTEYHIKELNEKGKKLLEIAIKSVGITIMVIKDPIRGDVDNSGRIDLKEAFMLGIALNIDAAMACMGSVMAGLSCVLMPVFVAAAQVVSIQVGSWMGKKISKTGMFNDKIVSFIPGIVLITLGILKILT